METLTSNKNFFKLKKPKGLSNGFLFFRVGGWQGIVMGVLLNNPTQRIYIDAVEIRERYMTTEETDSYDPRNGQKSDYYALIPVKSSVNKKIRITRDYDVIQKQPYSEKGPYFFEDKFTPESAEKKALLSFIDQFENGYWTDMAKKRLTELDK